MTGDPSIRTAAAAHPLRISAVVPTLEEASWIRGSLRALRDQLGPADELRVVDGGSRDGTVEEAAGLADVVEVAGPGRAAQMNHGARGASGDILWFVHADTVVLPGAAAAVREAVARGARWGRFDIAIRGASAWFPLVAALLNRRSCWSGIATGDQGIFVTRAAFDEVGGYPPLALMEDVALSRALRRRRMPACLPRLLETSGRRWEERGVGRTILRMWALRLAFALGVPAERLARYYR